MIKFEKIQPGMRLADIHRRKLGNTTASALGLWWVDIISVDPVAKTAVVRWNWNPPQVWNQKRLEKLCAENSPRVARVLGYERRSI